MGDLFNSIWRVFRFMFAVSLFVTEALFWVVVIAIGATTRLIDFMSGQRVLKDGKIFCEKGHANDTEHLPLECQKCGYRYVGSIWICGSKECSARTIYTNCKTCGLSIRSPWRWGRP